MTATGAASFVLRLRRPERTISMIVNEIFYSLQGEGSLAGVPSVFIRLADCPLRCRWCDTAYARDPQAGTQMTPQTILPQIADYPTRRLVITGGEPTVQDGLGAFMRVFADAGYHITLETSAYRFVPDLPIQLASISPKLSNTGDVPVSKRLSLAAIGQYVQTYPYQIKFVVDAPHDLNEIAECLEQLEQVDPERVFLMPQAAGREEYLAKSQWLSEYCLQTGFSFSPRLHVMLYDGRRGK